MKKVLMFITVLVLTILIGGQGVFAETVAETTEPVGDVWVDIISDFASLKNFLVTSFSIGGVVTLIKLRNAWKYFKTPKGIATIETIGFNILKKVTDKPELVTQIMSIVVQFPVVKQIIDTGKRKAEMYEVEILDKIVNLEAKLEAQVFADNPIKQQEAVLLLQKLREEYEIIQSD